MKTVILLVFCWVLLSCTNTPKTYHSQQFVFGTIVDLTFIALNDAQAQAIQQSVQAQLQHYHDAWHAWQPSQLTRLNKAIKHNQSIEISAELAELLRQSQQLSAQSNGLFNPAIGHLIRLWGFQRHDNAPWQPPSEQQLSEYFQHPPQMNQLSINNTQLSSSNPNIQLDLGAIAKGYAVDKVIAYLKQQGIQDAIVNAGGDLKSIGQNRTKPWRIGIQDPTKQDIIGYIDSQDGESIFTSGNYQRFYTYQGQTYHHLIDPRTGRPSNQVVSATIIHPSATVADAAATAFMLNGTRQWQALAKQMGIKYLLLLDKSGKITMTQAMASRVKLKARFKKNATIEALAFHSTQNQ